MYSKGRLKAEETCSPMVRAFFVLYFGIGKTNRQCICVFLYIWQTSWSGSGSIRHQLGAIVPALLSALHLAAPGTEKHRLMTVFAIVCQTC